jgi:hypothetical protein
MADHARWFGERHMIHADLQHHTHSAEDRFTSNCLGLLRLLPDSDFIDFFSRAMKLDRTRLDLSRYKQVSTIDFWPWLPPAGFPDVITALQNKNGPERLTLIIEVKHGALKLGGTGAADTGETSENPDSTQSDRPPGDQLARYWLAGCKYFRCPAVIYLTHHRSLPKGDIERSLSEAGSEARIFWLSWFDLYRWTSHQLTTLQGRPISEARILTTLHAYLTANEYRCFLGWSSLPSMNACRVDHNRTSVPATTTDISQSFRVGYRHAYELDRVTMPVRPLRFYRTRQEEL